MSQQQSLEQKRAARAWECVTDVRDNHKAFRKDYGSLARSAPADIQSNGLGQTLAFWRAKGKEEHKAIYAHVTDWVKKQMNVTQPDLLAWVMSQASTDQYRQATAEAMAFLQWLKRFAEAELGEEK